MLQLTQGIVSLKKVVRRGITKRGDGKHTKVQPHVAGRRLLPSGSWVVLEPSVWPRQVTPAEGSVETAARGASAPFNGSSDSLPSSSPASSASPSIFSQNNSSTSSVLTMPTPLLDAVTPDDEAEKAGRRSDIEWEYKEMYLGKGEKTKVRHYSESDTNSPGKITAEPWSCEDGQIVVQTTCGYSVIAPATGRRSSRTTGMSFKIGMGMDHYEALAMDVAAHTSRRDHEGMVFTSNVYDDLICDQHSYETWVEWTRGRPAEDRVLWVLA